MKRRKNIVFFVIIFIISLTAAACAPEGEQNEVEEVIESGGAYEVDIIGLEDGENNSNSGENNTENEVNLESLDEGDTSEQAKEDNLKVLSTYKMEAETKDVDSSLELITKRVHDLNGYISKKNIDKKTTAYTTADISIRVPRDNLKDLVSFIEEELSINSESFISADITEKYSSVESKLEILEEKEKRLRELYKETKDVSKIIEIDDKITEVEEEKNEIIRKKDKMDRGIIFSKLDITMEEVKRYSDKERENESFSSEVGNALSDTGSILSKTFTEIISIIIRAIPFLIGGLALYYLFVKFIKDRMFEEKEKKEKDNESDKN